MVEFTLPKNSKVTQGQDLAARAEGRWQRNRVPHLPLEPDDGQNPRIDTYDVDLDDCGPMVLDALI